MYRLTFILPFLLLFAACGGGGSGSHPVTGGGNGSGGSGSQPGLNVPVSISSGQTQTGIDIAVPAPVGSPAPNAQVIGVAMTTGQASAANTGAQIHRGATGGVVFLCGDGLSGSMQVKISGPADISVGTPQSVNCTSSSNKTIAGIQFGVTVSATAALGGRTVLLISPQNDITTFSGGLEVIP